MCSSSQPFGNSFSNGTEGGCIHRRPLQGQRDGNPVCVAQREVDPLARPEQSSIVDLQHASVWRPTAALSHAATSQKQQTENSRRRMFHVSV